MSDWAVVLAGGSGTRFWPLSTAARPKQLLPLAGEAPLLRQTVTRLEGVVPPQRVLVLTGAALADRIAALLPEVPRANVLVEPRAASTAPALVWAARHIASRDPDARMLSLHADWAIGDDARFRAAAARALDVAAARDVLVTVGVRPTRDEPGLGYIVPGAALGRGARRVRRFVEKPTVARARVLRRAGALWNTGLFAWTTTRFLAEARDHARELRRGWAALAADDGAAFFAAVTPVAVDVAVLERTGRLAVVTGRFPWDDIGSWDALRRVGPVTVGPDVRDCVLWSDGEPVTVIGVREAVVVRANGRTLVMGAGRAADLKRLVER
jgi:mannose-1-phosphate guanylyltransferase